MSVFQNEAIHGGILKAINFYLKGRRFHTIVNDGRSSEGTIKIFNAIYTDDIALVSHPDTARSQPDSHKRIWSKSRSSWTSGTSKSIQGRCKRLHLPGIIPIESLPSPNTSEEPAHRWGSGPVIGQASPGAQYHFPETKLLCGQLGDRFAILLELTAKK
ncbi:hypothetical protein Trydic_g10982 [Trypoxylus dichotomus]